MTFVEDNKMNNYAIKNATIVNEGNIFVATLFISNDKIERIVKGIHADTTDYTVIDATGKFLFPGIIDTHVHFRDPGLTYKGDMFSESCAAVAGGITSIADMPNTIPQTTTVQHFIEKCRHAEHHSLVNYSFFLGATNDNLKELTTVDKTHIIGIKMFMGSSTGNMQVGDQNVLEHIFANTALPIVAHCEDETRIKQNTEKIKQQYGDNPPASVHPLIRDAESCFISSKKAVGLAEKYGTRLHIAHLSTEKELSLLRNDLPLHKKQITGEVCVHHLWFSDEDYATKGNQIKCNPAIKSKEDRHALRHALKDNLLDAIATDHAPHTWEEKSQPYFTAPSGIPLIQHALPAMLDLVDAGIFSIEMIVEKMCHNPAILFKIKNRGFIREGYFADLVVVDMNGGWSVAKNNILYKCRWSPFLGRSFISKITHTFINGNLVWENGQIDDTKKGKQLEFNR